MSEKRYLESGQKQQGTSSEYWKNVTIILKMCHNLVDKLKPWISESPPPLSNF